MSARQKVAGGTEMVEAWGDNGLELVPASEAVEIPFLPVADGNKGIPATIRALRFTFGTPKRLTGIRMTSRPWPLVTWRDENGGRASCFLRNESDARDRLFDSLPASSRARLLLAVQHFLVKVGNASG